jgi:Domain of unknown function (DUF5943)
MGMPQLPIEVDAETGVWTTDNLPMIYVPRHFFVNNHMEVEAALGIEVYAASLFKAGYKSAWYWCDKEAATHKISGIEVFEHYLKRLSQRGWGLFSIDSIDVETGEASIGLNHSVFVYQYGKDTGRAVCYMFAGWFPGALNWVRQSQGLDELDLDCVEIACGADGINQSCRFSVFPKSK